MTGFKNIIEKAKEYILSGTEWLRSKVLDGVIYALIASPLIIFFTGFATGPKAYNIYFVGDFDDPKVSNSWKKFDSILSKREIDGVPINVHKVDAEASEAGDISKIIAHRNDTIFVVGHFSSTASRDALFNYISADPPIPVILPVESNPDLIARDISERFLPVFRLVPTDDEQAKRAATFAHEIGAKRIWVIEDDASNPVYTHYLSTQFIQQIQTQFDEKEYLNQCELPSSQCKVQKKKPGKVDDSNRYHSRVVLWTSIKTPPSPELLNSLKVDLIFLAAAEHDCMIISNQIKQIWKGEDRPTLLSGKGCERDLTDPENVVLLDTYLTHHLSADLFHSDEFDSVPGMEAASVITQILEKTKDDRVPLSEEMGWVDSIRYIFNFHDAGDVRRAIANTMEKGVDTERFDIIGAVDSAKGIRFRKDGQVDGKAFRVWQLQKEKDVLKFVDLEKQ